MSAESLKFFEDRSTEEIINWMLSNLSEDQIRGCLDQSGIPDTSVIKAQPTKAAIPRVTPPEEGSSSSDPIVPKEPTVPVEPIVPVEPTPASDENEITEGMLKGLKIQQGSEKIMEDEYSFLHSKGLKMYPVFIYGSDGDRVLHLTPVVVDGKISFKQASTHKRLLNSGFKKATTVLKDAVDSGLYTQSGDMLEELNNALKTISPEISERISKIYDPIRLNGFTYFGSLDDELDDIDEFPEMPANLPMPSAPVAPRNKKISDMSIPEIEAYMRERFGDKYARDYMPEKYTNSLGVINVRYVKRTEVSSGDEPFIKSSVFAEFAGRPRFDDDSEDEELLFD